MYVIAPEIEVPKPLTNTFLLPVTAHVHPLLDAHVNMLWSPVQDPPARTGSCCRCSMGIVEARGRAFLALGLLSFQMHPLSVSVSVPNCPSRGHLGSRRRTLLCEEGDLVYLNRETMVPVTHLLVLSNTLLHHLGAKRLLLGFWFFFFSLKG